MTTMTRNEHWTVDGNDALKSRDTYANIEDIISEKEGWPYVLRR